MINASRHHRHWWSKCRFKCASVGHGPVFLAVVPWLTRDGATTSLSRKHSYKTLIDWCINSCFHFLFKNNWNDTQMLFQNYILWEFEYFISLKLILLYFFWISKQITLYKSTVTTISNTTFKKIKYFHQTNLNHTQD